MQWVRRNDFYAEDSDGCSICALSGMQPQQWLLPVAGRWCDNQLPKQSERKPDTVQRFLEKRASVQAYEEQNEVSRRHQTPGV